MSCAMGGGAVLDAVTAPVGAVPTPGEDQCGFGFPLAKI